VTRPGDIKKVLVPVDFSDGARAAIDLAALFARSFGASVELFHVWQPPPLIAAPIVVVTSETEGRPMSLEDLARNAATTQLKDLMAELKKTGLEAHCRVGIGNPAHEILELARTGGFDLIVMGTHGRTGFAHAFMGSVAEKVVRRAGCPVVSVRVPE
jgi:nucleotide-binding universal stress UspA family protein